MLYTIYLLTFLTGCTKDPSSEAIAKHGPVDTDLDGLDDETEGLFGTDPALADTDGDGLSDGEELFTYHTNPLSSDSDTDGLDDASEVLTHATNATSWDTDGDGVGDGEEVAAGADPLQNEDRDGDGWLDADEATAGSDPENPFSWPFGTDQWPDLSETAVDVNGTTYATGEVFPDFLAYDQFGNNVSLYQFYGYAILLDFSAMWCGPCQDAAPGTQEMWENYREQGFMVITMLTDDFDNNPPTAEECMEWADAFGLEYPVLGGEVPDEVYFDLYDAGINEGYIPYLMLLDSELRIHKIYSGSGNEAAIERDLKDLGFTN